MPAVISEGPPPQSLCRERKAAGPPSGRASHLPQWSPAVIGVSYVKRRQGGQALNEFNVTKPTLTAKYLVGQVGGLAGSRVATCDLRHLHM
jgi:hypothetical protein